MNRFFWKWLPVLMLCGFLIVAGLPIALAATASSGIDVTANMNSWITISSPANVNLGNFDRGTDTSGTADWAVATNDTAGYKLEIATSSTPSLRHDTSPTIYYFDDYNMDTTSVPTSWSVGASDAEFGFSVTGNDAGSEYSSGTKFRGTTGTVPIQIATSSSETSSTTTTVILRAEVGSSKFLLEGGYSGRITATATTL